MKVSLYKNTYLLSNDNDIEMSGFFKNIGKAIVKGVSYVLPYGVVRSAKDIQQEKEHEQLKTAQLEALTKQLEATQQLVLQRQLLSKQQEADTLTKNNLDVKTILPITAAASVVLLLLTR